MLTGDNDKNKILKIKAFSKTQVYHTTGGFYAPIKVNKTSVLNYNFQHIILKKRLLKSFKSSSEINSFLHFNLKTTFESCIK